MVLGSVAAPVVAWRALPAVSDRPFAIAALVIACIDAAFVAVALAASLVQ